MTNEEQARGMPLAAVCSKACLEEKRGHCSCREWLVKALDEAEQREREACARLIENTTLNRDHIPVSEVVAAIRARQGD